MSIKNKIADSDSPLFLPVKLVFYRFFNKYYEVNNIIAKSEIDSDGDIVIELKNGIKLSSPPSKFPADRNFTERYNFGTKSKMDKILDVNKFFFMYEVLSELFIYSEYFRYGKLKEGDVVIDAGANIGGFTVQAAQKIGKSGHIFAIEPNEENRKTLTKNLSLNNITNCTIITDALWSEKCTKEFFISHRPGEHTLIDYTGDPHFQRKNVETIYCERLDDIIQKHGIQNVAYLKMDIEGAEIEAIKGASNFLNSQSPFLLIEALHEVNGKPAYNEIIPLVKDAGYELQKEIDNYRGTILAYKR
ncbi:MAG: FkbM family methyltransferase [Candidatus Kapabacteria bacterium]|nr:FkbM family methyltransferase [Ignavibacteriota bacterium]MCW5885631.1 FkbM family methyltransferase [Candidatus Kapabacteria bacterium]